MIYYTNGALHRGFKSLSNKQQQRLYGMYDVISVLLFILYTSLENLIIDESCKTCKSRS